MFIITKKCRDKVYTFKKHLHASMFIKTKDLILNFDTLLCYCLLLNRFMHCLKYFLLFFLNISVVTCLNKDTVGWRFLFGLAYHFRSTVCTLVLVMWQIDWEFLPSWLPFISRLSYLVRDPSGPYNHHHIWRYYLSFNIVKKCPN